MSQDALALKYRPKKIADLVGQDHVKKILSNSISQGKMHHAYIFAGKFGCGKTSAARIFAASVNNPGNPSLDPDLNSDLVQAIFKGKHPDVRELDAAATRSIDDIRDIKDSIKYNPLECRRRFIIIDEAHRLTGAAAEAALKMIEEPPKNCIFILCTTDPDKLKDTIHSRCMALKFNKISWNAIYNHLSYVSKQEGIEIDDMSLKIAARKSHGSLRSALQNLQMLITFAGSEKITSDFAQTVLSAVDESLYINFVDAISKPDVGEAMRIIDQLLSDGRDVGDVLDGLVGHLRNLIIIKTCPSTKGILHLTDAEKKNLLKHLENLPSQNTVPFLCEMVKLLQDVNRSINMNMNPQTVLEVFAVNAAISCSQYKRKSS